MRPLIRPYLLRLVENGDTITSRTLTEKITSVEGPRIEVKLLPAYIGLDSISLDAHHPIMLVTFDLPSCAIPSWLFFRWRKVMA